MIMTAQWYAGLAALAVILSGVASSPPSPAFRGTAQVALPSPGHSPDVAGNHRLRAKRQSAVTCGVRTEILGDRILTDDFAAPGDAPWMTAMFQKQPKKPICGGALISNTAVLTTAHNIAGASAENLLVVVGRFDLNSTDGLLPYQELGVDSIIVHPKFHATHLENDIALVILKKPVKAQAHIMPACVPDQGLEVESDECFVTGWGATKDGRASSNKLELVELKVVPRTECQVKLRNTTLGAGFMLHRSHLCAGGTQSRDACKGDGGSPLVCPFSEGGKTRYYVSGLVSWGVGCGQDNVPGVYTDVAFLKTWIDKELSGWR